MLNVIVIDDQPPLLSEIRSMLKREYSVTTCSSPLRGVRMIRKSEPDLVVVTLVMKEMDGFEVIRRLKSSGCQMPIVMISAYGDASTPAEATRLGASDYISRPILADELLARLRRVMERQMANAMPAPIHSLQDGICTADPEMLSLLELAHIAANTDSRILILGETGTGKELIAQTIHRYSGRSTQPFIEVNCAAIQPNLLESELFGHEKGSFTGAEGMRKGKFEQASGGTLFLDEIGEMSLEMQSKMLRVLQNGDYTRVGGDQRQVSTARIVAATNQDLRALVNDGLFRADLYFRLNVVTLTLPPLRRRPCDILLLANLFLTRFNQPGNPPKRISEAALRVLAGYPWPGNVRELEHLIERLSILVSKQVIDVEALPDYVRDTATRTPLGELGEIIPYQQARAEFERQYFTQAVYQAQGNLSQAARIAGMDRSQFYRMHKRSTESE
ncbi:sigma-54-dependent transcriptional regulator [Cerasicoccus arenae]|uniref:Alginate biosynthesis transcriptional regulatory protein AlgB n=1 Tax=Cerasicoccus arenae TaxID=424488 RepID=A0A8J3D6Q0_9BACT|nr:sigma-54 dependent transcriptional regulator [Cerasicoccus arenae]MBK1858293.1 sigma-54-dependent Fis family transcriptional regulator [Cerasicoccus arenae]GHB90579.1 alginate biosynthesis transcriptional regulatory protein AlgB [Cerasicoccus arenae]